MGVRRLGFEEGSFDEDEVLGGYWVVLGFELAREKMILCV
jgi:hypothetical protein